MSWGTHSQTDQSPHVLRHTPTKTSESTILGGHTLSNRSETSCLGSHTHTHRSKTLAIRHTLTNTMELTSSDGQIEVSRSRTPYPFLIAVLTNHHNLSVMKKHTFIYYITFLYVRNPKVGLPVSPKIRCKQSCLPSGDSKENPFPCLFQFPEPPAFLVLGPFLHL